MNELISIILSHFQHNPKPFVSAVVHAMNWLHRLETDEDGILFTFPDGDVIHEDDGPDSATIEQRLWFVITELKGTSQFPAALRLYLDFITTTSPHTSR